MALSDLFSRRRKTDSDSEVNAADAPVHPTKALARFLSALSSREQPHLLDLGPVVGTNLTFFGEQLGCKMSVEDVSKDIDRHVQEQKTPELAAFFGKRFAQGSESFDGILCWDVLDYLDKAAGQALAKEMVRLLKPDGVLLAFFATVDTPANAKPTYTRHVVVDQTNLQHRPYQAARGKQKPLLNRDIQRMFEPLRITDQFLLKNNLREVLFRKAAESA